MPNRLAQETSPYLRQHQSNPVEWYPWGEEALARARAENKPILLSIGYSACHWCHVMEEESFENPQIAAVMNERFINIKVDREERPDLDQIYQNVAQAMTRSGGWPLTVFLTPDRKPFFGGTYFPPEDRYGRPGFPRVLEALSQAYQEDPEGVAENARTLTEFIGAAESVAVKEKGLPNERELQVAAEAILDYVDWGNGGLQGAPKFPNAMLFTYLWRHGVMADEAQAREATLLLLERMASGGIYDQLGGGFHRYSVDETWSVPHFEKMLYDNGILLKLYSEALLAENVCAPAGVTEDTRELFTKVVAETVDYVLREMRSPEGGFFSAQDADSEGEEGKYFVWSPDDLAQSGLTEEEQKVFAQRYGVTSAGNFEGGKTVLYLADEFEPGREEVLESARRKLLAVRARRVPPATDRKILASWNGLMISGLAWASLALRAAGQGEAADRALLAARDAFLLVRTKMSREGNRLWGSFQEGKPKLNAYLDDYAFCAMAALDLARAMPGEEGIRPYLEAARDWVEVLSAHFRDEEGPGYFFTSDDHEALIHRPKSIFDQAIPSGTAVALECLAALAELDVDGTGAKVAKELSRQMNGLFPFAQKGPQAAGELLNAALLFVHGPVVVSGPDAILACTHAHVFRKPAEPSGARLVCHRNACSLPLESGQALRAEARNRLAG